MTEITVEYYSWVETSYLVYGSVFVLGKEMSLDPLKIRVSSNWEITPIMDEKRIFFHWFVGCSVPFYACIFQDLGVRLPLTHF